MKKYWIIIGLMLWTFADEKGTSFSGVYTKKPHWSESAEYKNSRYQGAIIADCKISALSGKGFPGLKIYLKKWFEDQSKSKKWTTVKNYFTIKKNGKTKKIDAIRITYVNIDKTNTGSLEMELDGYIGHEIDHVLMVESVSKKIIKASGDKMRLKKFKSFYRYNKAKQAGYYNVYCWRFYSLEGYWYEPTGMFVKGARKKALNSFTDAINNWMSLWSKNL